MGAPAPSALAKDSCHWVSVHGRLRCVSWSWYLLWLSCSVKKTLWSVLQNQSLTPAFKIRLLRDWGWRNCVQRDNSLTSFYSSLACSLSAVTFWPFLLSNSCSIFWRCGWASWCLHRDLCYTQPAKHMASAMHGAPQRCCGSYLDCWDRYRSKEGIFRFCDATSACVSLNIIMRVWIELLSKINFHTCWL